MWDVKLWPKLVVWKPCAIHVTLQPLNIDGVDSQNDIFRVQIFGLQMQLRIAYIPKAWHQAANRTSFIHTRWFLLAAGAPHDQDLGAIGGCP